MKLPGQQSYDREWHVGEEVWDLKFTRKLEGSLGECCPSERVMYILQGQSRHEILWTFFHEVCHALEFTYEIDIPHSEVYSFEKAWASFFLDNWEAFAKLITLAKRAK
jgi:hypothetical protein